MDYNDEATDYDYSKLQISATVDTYEVISGPSHRMPFTCSLITKNKHKIGSERFTGLNNGFVIYGMMMEWSSDEIVERVKNIVGCSYEMVTMKQRIADSCLRFAVEQILVMIRITDNAFIVFIPKHIPPVRPIIATSCYTRHILDFGFPIMFFIKTDDIDIPIVAQRDCKLDCILNSIPGIHSTIINSNESDVSFGYRSNFPDKIVTNVCCSESMIKPLINALITLLSSQVMHDFVDVKMKPINVDVAPRGIILGSRIIFFVETKVIYNR